MTENRQQYMDLCDGLDRRLTAKDMEQDEQISKIAHNVDAHYRHFTGVCELQGKQADAQSAAQTERAADTFKHFTEEWAKIDQRLVAATGAHNERLSELQSAVDQHYQHWVATNEKMGARFEQHNAIQDTQIDQANQRLDRNLQHCIDLNDQLQTRVVEKHDHLDHRLNDLSSSINSANQQFSQMFEDMQQKFSDKNATQDALAEIQSQRFLDTVNTLENSNAEKSGIGL